MLGVKQVLGVTDPGVASNVEEIQVQGFPGYVPNASFTSNATIYWRGDDMSESIGYVPIVQFSDGVDQGQTSMLSALSWNVGPYTYQWFEQATGGSYVAVGTHSSSFNFVTSNATALATGASFFNLPTSQATR